MLLTRLEELHHGIESNVYGGKKALTLSQTRLYLIGSRKFKFNYDFVVSLTKNYVLIYQF